MQTKDIFRTRTFRIIDRCTVFMLVFTCASFLVYIIGSYQAFLPDTMMMLLRTVEVSSLALIGCSAFASVMIFFYIPRRIPRRRIFALGKLSVNLFFILIALIFLHVSAFIIACV